MDFVLKSVLSMGNVLTRHAESFESLNNMHERKKKKRETKKDRGSVFLKQIKNQIHKFLEHNDEEGKHNETKGKLGSGHRRHNAGHEDDQSNWVHRRRIAVEGRRCDDLEQRSDRERD